MYCSARGPQGDAEEEDPEDPVEGESAMLYHLCVIDESPLQQHA